MRPSSICHYFDLQKRARTSEGLSHNFRGNLRKARNKLAQLPDVQFVRSRTTVDIEPLFEQFLAVEASGWKGPRGSAIMIDERLRRFYEAVMRNYAGSGTCEINVLRAQGKCLAAQFCLLTDDTKYVIKIGYDEAYARCAPGNLLFEWLLNDSKERHFRFLNVLSDAEWHLDWKQLSHQVSDLFVFNRTLAGLTAFAAGRPRHAGGRTRRTLLGQPGASTPPQVLTVQRLRSGPREIGLPRG